MEDEDFGPKFRCPSFFEELEDKLRALEEVAQESRPSNRSRADPEFVSWAGENKKRRSSEKVPLARYPPLREESLALRNCRVKSRRRNGSSASVRNGCFCGQKPKTAGEPRNFWLGTSVKPLSRSEKVGFSENHQSFRVPRSHSKWPLEKNGMAPGLGPR